MAINPKGGPLETSLLDRLLVERRGRRRIRDIREFVAQDLEDLLNTRRRCGVLPAEFTELRKSLVNYGLPDFTGIKMSNVVERHQLRKLLEEAIRTYEPRLLKVNVVIVERADPQDRQIHFRIEATLNTHPTPEPVVFDSTLEPASAEFDVK